MATDRITKELGNDGRPGRAVRNMVAKVRSGRELTEKRRTAGRRKMEDSEIAPRIRAEMNGDGQTISGNARGPARGLGVART